VRLLRSKFYGGIWLLDVRFRARKKSKIYTTYHRQPSHPKAEYFQFPLLLTPDIVNFGNNIGYQLQPALHHRRAL